MESYSIWIVLGDRGWASDKGLYGGVKVVRVVPSATSVWRRSCYDCEVEYRIVLQVLVPSLCGTSMPSQASDKGLYGGVEGSPSNSCRFIVNDGSLASIVL